MRLRTSVVPSTILCPGPFYTDFSDMEYASWDGDVLVFSTPAAPTKRMGWSDPGHDIGWFARAVLDVGPNYMKDEHIPVSGPVVAYEELASKFSAVTGVKAVYRQCKLDEFEKLEGMDGLKGKEVKELGAWLAVAPDDSACYGTIPMEKLEQAQKVLDVQALSWDKFLERTGWRGPARKQMY